MISGSCVFIKHNDLLTERKCLSQDDFLITTLFGLNVFKAAPKSVFQFKHMKHKAAVWFVSDYKPCEVVTVKEKAMCRSSKTPWHCQSVIITQRALFPVFP